MGLLLLLLLSLSSLLLVSVALVLLLLLSMSLLLLLSAEGFLSQTTFHVEFISSYGTRDAATSIVGGRGWPECAIFVFGCVVWRPAPRLAETREVQRRPAPRLAGNRNAFDCDK